MSEGRNIAHGRFISQHVTTWASAADEFMQRYFKKPALNFSHRCIGTSFTDDDE